MAATSRHLAAVEEVLVPLVAKRLEGGRQMSHDYLVDARHLEAAVARLKARLYGELHAAYVPWDEVWADVRKCLDKHNEAERFMVGWLSEVLEPAEAGELATKVYRAELRAPTRAHPHIPHTGLIGLAARRIWAIADRFWDAAENRAVPPPIRPRRRKTEHTSLMSQYLTGEPTLDSEAPLMEHRHREQRHRHDQQE
jgi:hypothetical protein